MLSVNNMNEVLSWSSNDLQKHSGSINILFVCHVLKIAVTVYSAIFATTDQLIIAYLIVESLYVVHLIILKWFWEVFMCTRMFYLYLT